MSSLDLSKNRNQETIQKTVIVIVIVTKLELVNRTKGDAIKVHPTDPLLSVEPQRRLAELYAIYDIRCLCTADGVLMHIRHLSKTGLYFVADNPTSGMHSQTCRLATSRIGVTDMQAEVPSPVDSVEFTFSEPGTHNGATIKPGKTAQRNANYQHTRQLYLLFLTLLQNGYCNIAFSGFRSFQALATKMIDAKSRTIALVGSDLPVNKLISYGAGGLQYAMDRAKKSGIAFWLAYTPEIKAITGQRTITLYDHEHHGVTITRPYAATGPHICLALISRKGIVEIALQPVVDHKFVFPVFSDQGRQDTRSATSLLPETHTEGESSWVKVDLWGDDQGPGRLYLVEKGARTNGRQSRELSNAPSGT